MKDLFVSELCIKCRDDKNCISGEFCSEGCCVPRCTHGECRSDMHCGSSGWVCRGDCCYRPTLNANEEVKDPFASKSELSNQEDSDFVYIGKSGKGSKHECRNHNDCRSNERCVYSRSRGYRVCKRKSSGRTCKRNGDCKNKNERCSDAGYCIKDNGRKPTSGDTCNKRSDCGSNRSCSGGYCVRRDLDLEGAMEEE